MNSKIKVEIIFSKYRKMMFYFPYSYVKKVIISSIVIILFGFIAYMEPDSISLADMFMVDSIFIFIVSILMKGLDIIQILFRYKRLIRKNPDSFFYELFINDTYLEKRSDTVIQKIYPNHIRKMKKIGDDFYIVLNDKNIIVIENIDEKTIQMLYDMVHTINPKIHVHKDDFTKSYIGIRIFLLIWFFITIIAVWWIYLSILIFSHSLTNQPSDLFLTHIWKSIFCIPIPLISIVLGLIYQRKGILCTKNIVGGVIILCLFLIITWAGISFDPKLDYKDAQKWESILTEKLPSKGVYYQIVWDESTLLEHISSHIKMTEKEAAHTFYQRLKQNKNWISSWEISDVKNLIPTSLVCKQKNCYYSIYIEELNTYNVLPNRAGQYHIYASMYNPNNQYLSIEQFMLPFVE